MLTSPTDDPKRRQFFPPRSPGDVVYLLYIVYRMTAGGKGLLFVLQCLIIMHLYREDLQLVVLRDDAKQVPFGFHLCEGGFLLIPSQH